jgi:hypothetical protein
MDRGVSARGLSIALTVVLVGLGVAYVLSMATYWRDAGIVGVDFVILRDAAARWLTGGGFYLPYQVAGPYVHSEHVGAQSPVLYPPTMLLLFVPFTILPGILWWSIPIAVTGWVVVEHRPRPLVWPVIAFLAVFPMTIWAAVAGNPILWFMMALALGTRYWWPSVLVLLKPTLAPFAVLGIWRRSWWVALAVLVVVCLPFGQMWFDYVRVLSNMTTASGPLFSLNQYPMMMIPVVAWLGRTAPPQEVEVRGVVASWSGDRSA